MIHHHFWLSGAPTYDKHAYEAYLREVQQARATVYYAAFTAIGRGVLALAHGAGAIGRLIRRKQRERATLGELSALDDHILDDIGLTRSDVENMAHRLAADPEAPLGAARAIPGADETELPERTTDRPRWLRSVVGGLGPETSAAAAVEQGRAANDSGPRVDDREFGPARCA